MFCVCVCVCVCSPPLPVFATGFVSTLMHLYSFPFHSRKDDATEKQDDESEVQLCSSMCVSACCNSQKLRCYEISSAQMTNVLHNSFLLVPVILDTVNI